MDEYLSSRGYCGPTKALSSSKSDKSDCTNGARCSPNDLYTQ